jgi:hypothetical protein
MKEEHKQTSKFVDNDILRYFYGEMSEEEKNAFEQTLMLDKNLRKSYKELTFTLGMFPNAENTYKSPEPELINNILAFSKNSVQQHSTVLTDEKSDDPKLIKIRKFTPRPIMVGMAILLSAIVNFSGYSQYKYKQTTNKKVKHEALEWENLDHTELQKLHRDLNVLKEHKGGILPADSAIYEVVTHDENTTIVLP